MRPGRVWCVLISCLCVLFLRSAAQTNVPIGVYIRNGETMLGVTPYRAMGVNYNNCFGLLLRDAGNHDFVEGFRILKEDYKIPYIRFMAGPFDHRGWALYAENPEEYFRRMDRIVKQAEKQGLGLIPSLFWDAVAVPDFCNEPLSALGERESLSRVFIRKYTADLVARYKDSPAIFGWELGNEYLLKADLPKYNHLPPKKTGADVPRTKADKLLRPMFMDLYKDFYRTVRELDKDRIVVTGDSIARAQAWHNRNEDRWGQDTRQQWLEQFRVDTPECYETVSFHLYAEADGKYFEGENLPLEQFVLAVAETCRSQGKAIWCGELGMPGTDGKSKEVFNRMIKSVEDNQIDLSAVWNFIPSGRYQADWDIFPEGERNYMLEAIKELNERFAKGAWQ